MLTHGFNLIKTRSYSFFEIIKEHYLASLNLKGEFVFTNIRYDETFRKIQSGIGHFYLIRATSSIPFPQYNQRTGSEYRKETKALMVVRTKIRALNDSLATKKSYVLWIKQFIHFHSLKHPKDMGPTEVEAFLTYLAVKRNVAPATQNQALCSLLFLYKQVLEALLDCLIFVSLAILNFVKEKTSSAK